MKKYLILNLIAFLFICICLSGCNESKTPGRTPEEKIIGAWERSDGRILKVYENSSYSVSYDDVSGIGWGVWNITETHITLYWYGLGTGYTYEFKNNDNTLEITEVGTGVVIVYARVD